MADFKWICTVDCYLNNRLYSRGDIVLSPTNPSTSFFSQYTNDPAVMPGPVGKTDLDGTYYYGAVGWDDFRFPVSSTRLGSNSKPDYDYTNNGFLFPQNDTAEVLYASDQFPHSMYTGPLAVIKPHLHIIQSAATQAVFKLKYRIHQNGQAVSNWTTLTSTANVFPYTSGSIAQILPFPDISVAGQSISALIDIQLYREDNAVTGDVLVKSMDFHIPIDSLGSGQDLSK